MRERIEREREREGQRKKKKSIISMRRRMPCSRVFGTSYVRRSPSPWEHEMSVSPTVRPCPEPPWVRAAGR